MGGVVAEPDSDLLARLALSAAFEPGSEVVGQVVAEFGASEVVGQLDDPRSSLCAPTVKPLRARWIQRDWLGAAEAELNLAEQEEVSFVTPSDSRWPVRLNDLDLSAPLVLRVKGSAELSCLEASVGIVGARSATHYGVAVAQEFASELSCRGIHIVSGAAFGIDAAAHLGALAVDVPTVAISAAGVDRASPMANYSLFQRMYEQGAVVSEVPLGSVPSKHRFLVRNRLIAALTQATVVVEAASRSGALSTARHAEDLQRAVFAIPGPVTSALSAGCHSLIRTGSAKLAATPADVLRACDPPGLW